LDLRNYQSRRVRTHPKTVTNVTPTPPVRESPTVRAGGVWLAQTVTASGFTDYWANTTYTRTVGNPVFETLYVSADRSRWIGLSSGTWYLAIDPITTTGAVATSATFVNATWTTDAGATTVDVANPVVADWSTGTLQDADGHDFITDEAFVDNSSGANWATTTPTSINEAINRIAAAVAGLLTTPIP